MAIEKKRLVQNRPWLGLLKRPSGLVRDMRFLAEAVNLTFQGGIAKPRDPFRCANSNQALGSSGPVTCVAPFVTGAVTLGLSGSISCVIATEGVSSGSTVSKLSDVPTTLGLSLGTLVPGLSNVSQEWQGSSTEPTVYAQIADMLILANGANGAIKIAPVSGKTESMAVYQLGLGKSATPTTPGDEGLSMTVTGFGSLPSSIRYRSVVKSTTTGAVAEPSGKSILLGSANMRVSFGPTNSGISLTADFDGNAITKDGQYDRYELYRTVANSAGRYYYVGDASALSVFVDSGTVSDAALVTRRPLEEFVNYPIRGRLRLVTAFKSRLWGVTTEDPNFLYCSDLGPYGPKPDAWPLLNFVPVNVGDGDEIRAIHGFQDRLLIFKRRSIWELVGDWPQVELRAISYRPDGTGIGTFNQYSVAMFDDMAIFAFYDGLYVLGRGQKLNEGLTTKKISSPVDNIFTAADFDWTQSSLNRFVRLAWDRTKRQLWFFYPTTSGTKGLVLQRDVAIEGESAWSEVHVSAANAPTYQAHAMIIQGGDDVLHVGDGQGRVYKLDSTKNADQYTAADNSVASNAINWLLKSHDLPPDNQLQLRLRRVAWHFASAPSSSDTVYQTITVKRTDGSTATTNETISGASPLPEKRYFKEVGRNFQISLSGSARGLTIAGLTVDYQELSPLITVLSR